MHMGKTYTVILQGNLAASYTNTWLLRWVNSPITNYRELVNKQRLEGQGAEDCEYKWNMVIAITCNNQRHTTIQTSTLYYIIIIIIICLFIHKHINNVFHSFISLIKYSFMLNFIFTRYKKYKNNKEFFGQ